MTSTAEVEALIARQRERTVARIAALTRDFEALIESTDSADDEHDPEGATAAFERAQVAALISQARAQLTELDHARERLDDGTYGVCGRCGRPIAVERLRARPTARTCELDRTS
ncbi:TraR/DksA C4-type zinc finger protein [soil metagenome]